MNGWIKRIFVEQWPRKLTALIAAVIIWVLVNHSITITRTIPNVSVRVLNVPLGKTIEGMLPNGLLNKHVTLTITGQKTTLQGLTPNDLEVVTDAAGKGDLWKVDITKRNLVSLNPDLDLIHGISTVQPTEFTIALSPLETANIPVTLLPPTGEPPKGYTFLDVWPQQLHQTLTGPKQRIEDLKTKGLKLRFDLSKISREELDQLHARAESHTESEIRYFVPENWKQIVIPFDQDKQMALNDPEASQLHLDFLRQEFIPLERNLPITVFYPLDTSNGINPELYSIKINELVTEEHGLTVLNLPLYAHNVSRRFLDTVLNNLEITIVARSADALPWSLQFIDPRGLEDAYVDASIALSSGEQKETQSTYLRQRFRNYLQEFELFRAPNRPLKLEAKLEGTHIVMGES